MQRFPGVGFFHAATHPEREERRQDADEKHGAPSVRGQYESHHRSRRREANGPGTLHEGQCATARLGGPALRHQRRTAGPLATHAEPQQRTENGKLPERLRQAARGGKHGVQQHTGNHRFGASVAIGHPSEEQAAGSATQQRDRPERTGLCLREPQLGDHRRQRERKEHHVEGIERPPHRGGDKRASRLRCSHAPPAHQAGVGNGGNGAHASNCAANVAASIFAPHTTMPTRCPSSRWRSGYISAANDAAPAGSTASFATRNVRRMASRI